MALGSIPAARMEELNGLFDVHRHHLWYSYGMNSLHLSGVGEMVVGGDFRGRG